MTSIRTSTFARSGVGQRFVSALWIGFTFGFMLALILDLSNSPFLDQKSQEERVSNNEEVSWTSLDDTVALEMAKRVRILCLILTDPSHHETKAQHIKATWGKRCNNLLFVSSANDSSLPAIGLDIEEDLEYSWKQTKNAFRYVYKHYLNEADWFMKAEEDSFVIMENLRFLLTQYSPEETIYFDSLFRPYEDEDPFSGQEGYILSRESLRLVVEDGLYNREVCPLLDEVNAGIEIGECLENAGATLEDGKDPLGRWRSFPLNFEDLFVQNEEEPEETLDLENVLHLPPFPPFKLPYLRGKDCCSDLPIIFHNVSPAKLYAIEYLIYQLRPYGLSKPNQF